MPSELGTIYNNLADLINAGVPIVRSIKIAAAGFKGKYRSVMEQMIFDINNGESIAESMSKRPNIFSRLDIMTTRAGETAGIIDKTFKQLACWHEFQYRMKIKLISGMLLPTLLIHLAAIFGPFPAYILGSRNLSGYLTSMLTVLALFYVPIGVVVFIYKFTPKNGLVRKLLDAIALRIPVSGPAVKALNIARFTRAFSLLSSAAVPPAQAAEQAVSATENYFVASWFAPMADSARRGNPLSEGLSSAKLDDYYIHSWLIGEESGDIDEVTDRLARIYLEKAEELFEHFYTWLPRLLYFYVSLIVIIQILKAYAGIHSTVGIGLQPWHLLSKEDITLCFVNFRRS